MSSPDKPLTFRQFIGRVAPRFRIYAHIELLIAILQRVADDELHRVMVYWPPRHGKSETVSRLFSAYYLYRHPERWVAITSYGAELAHKLSAAAQTNYLAAGGQIQVGETAVKHWRTGAGGGMWAAGVGGPATGKGFHLGICDDPLKNHEEAASPVIRQKDKDWWRSTFSSREEPGAAIVVIMTRWHEDDLAGWLLAEEAGNDEEPERWHIVNMPAIAEKEERKWPPTCTVEPDTRAVGDPLCPERYPLQKLRQIQRRSGAYFWAALYQQRPAPVEGVIFKREHWRYWQPRNMSLPPVRVLGPDGKITEIAAVELPDLFDDMTQSWDMSFKDLKTSDYVSGLVAGRVGANKYVLDYTNERMDIVQSMKAVAGMSGKWPRASGKLIEDKANGPAVIRMLSSKIAGLIPVEPEGGKVSRAMAAAPEVESGNIYLPHPQICTWTNDFIEHMAAFPNGAHDDGVDAFTQLIIWWQQTSADLDELAGLFSYLG